MSIKVYKRKKYLKDCEENHSDKIKSEKRRSLWNKIFKMRSKEL